MEENQTITREFVTNIHLDVEPFINKSNVEVCLEGKSIFTGSSMRLR